MEKKVRYKMYKAGKNWVVASLVFGGTFLGLLVGGPEIGRADVQVNAQSSTTSELRADTATSSSVQAKTSTVAITDATEKNTTNTNEQVKSVADTISVQNDSSASKTVRIQKKLLVSKCRQQLIALVKNLLLINRLIMKSVIGTITGTYIIKVLRIIIQVFRN